jgi:2-phospho-L-lactate guanylyltransferase
MTGCEMWGVVLVKPFRLAKQRLAGVFSEYERSELARLMLEDVLGALDACVQRLAGVIVVTADEEAADIARRHNAVVIKEAVAAGVNPAVHRAIGCLSLIPHAGIVVIPADLPQITAAEIVEMIDLVCTAPSVALVRASRDGGTNILACRPASVITPRFGADSFNQHCLAATQAGVTPMVLFAPRLGLDVDRPDDLEAFLSLDTDTRTHAYLSRLRIHERVRTSALAPVRRR